MTMTTFRAVWPITDAGLHPMDLINEAAQDLPSVAARHRVRIAGTPSFDFRHGRNTPGSQGAAYVITCDVPAEAICRAEYGHAALIEDHDTTPERSPNGLVQSR